jgi:glycogen debranching enzyme
MLGRDVCGELEVSRGREWLLTNGLGSYAMGTVAGSLERCYHGLLIEAAKPPLGRRLRLAKLDPTLELDGERVELDANLWQGDHEAPDGSPWLESFQLVHGAPTWTFLVHGRRLRRVIEMVPGASTVVVAWTLLDGGPPLQLTLRALGSLRSHHSTAWDDGAAPTITPVDDGLSVRFGDESPLRLGGDGEWTAGEGAPYRDFYLGIEAKRGLGNRDCHRHLGDLRLELRAGETSHAVASAEEGSPPGGAEAMGLARDRADDLLARRRAVRPGEPSSEERQLVLAADQFLVRRAVRGGDGEGRSVIAGYPWFGDWGRDTFIALPGLTLSTGRSEVAAEVLRTYAGFVDEGMLPNRFPGADEDPEYNTVDAAVWYFRAAEQTLEALEPAAADALAADLLPALEAIVAGYSAGTRHGIRVADDGLVRSGKPGVQLTWMDARVDGREVTPRMGKCVEINALWIHALHVLRAVRARVGADVTDLEQPIAKATRSFARFWNDETNCLYDVLDGPLGDDPAIRPNQILAASLPTCPLTAEQRSELVEVCRDRLLTSYGLRSLAPDDRDYVGNYSGSVQHRDGCYHQGTTWGWLIGPWVRARLLAGHAPAAVAEDLRPALQHLEGAALVGSVSEVYDGDAPFRPHGAPAQAWSVAELLAAWDLVNPLPAGG